MPRGRHWYQREPAAFIMATRGFDLEVVGAYSLIIDHLNDRDRPLPNDDKFMAGLLHCSTQRWRKIRAELIAEDKIFITADDYISNPRFDREQGEREEARLRSVEHGRTGGLISAARRAGQSELPMDEQAQPRTRTRARHARTEQPRKSNKVAKDQPELSQKIANSSARSLPEPTEPPKETQPLSSSPPSSSVRARQLESEKEGDSSQPNGVTDSRDEPLDGRDLHTLYVACLTAAGVVGSRAFSQPEQIDRAMTQVDRWREAGVSFDSVVVPTIRQMVLTSDGPTRTLGRFNAEVLHQHAKREAATKNGKPYRPPEIPRLSPDTEDPAFLPLRTALLEALGPDVFALMFNRVILIDPGECQGDKRPLKVDGPEQAHEMIVHGTNSRAVKRIAQAHGFTDIW